MRWKRMSMVLAKTLTLALILGISHASLANELTSGGFESGSPEIGLPSQDAIWGGDRVSFVASENGIVPLEGARMMSFDNTFWGDDGAGPARSSDVWQLVDAQSLRGESVVLRANFNRVAGDAYTDTRFILGIRAFAGAIETFDDQDPDIPPSLAVVSADLLTDGDPGTWEELVVDFDVPQDADYLGISVSAYENIQNDHSGIEFDGHYADDITLVLESTIDVPGVETMLPSIVLHDPYPNPFNPGTTVSFSVDRTATIRLSIFDVSGRLVRTLRDGATVPPGRYDVVWRGTDGAGRRVCSGVYFLNLESGGRRTTKRMVLVE